jgi:hypothetical protein
VPPPRWHGRNSSKVAEGLPTASLHPVRWWAHLEFTRQLTRGLSTSGLSVRTRASDGAST